MQIKHLVMHDKPTIISDNKFELLGFRMSNEFIMTIMDVIANKSPPIWIFFCHMWDGKDLLHVHGGFYEQADSGIIMFMQVHTSSTK